MKSKPSRFRLALGFVAAFAMILLGLGGPSLAHADDPVTSQPAATASASPTAQPSQDQAAPKGTNDQKAAPQEQPADQKAQAPKSASTPKGSTDDSSPNAPPKSTDTKAKAAPSETKQQPAQTVKKSVATPHKASSSNNDKSTQSNKPSKTAKVEDSTSTDIVYATSVTIQTVVEQGSTTTAEPVCSADGGPVNVPILITATAPKGAVVPEGELRGLSSGPRFVEPDSPNQYYWDELFNLPVGTVHLSMYDTNAGKTLGSTTITVKVCQTTPPGNGDTKKITYCHATPPATAKNGWTELTTSVNAFYKAGHDGHAADIVPPFSYTNDQGQTVNFAGLNWNTAGQAVFNNGCKSVQPPPPALVKVHGDVTFAEGSVACVDHKVVYTEPTFTVAGNEHVVYDQSRGTYQADFGQSVTIKTTGVDDSSKYELTGQTSWSHTFGSKPSAPKNCTPTPPPPTCTTSSADVVQTNSAVSATGAKPGDWVPLYNADDPANQTLLTKDQVGKDCTASVPVPAAQCQAHQYQWDLETDMPPAKISDTNGDGIADVPGFEQGELFTIPGDQSKCVTPPPVTPPQPKPDVQVRDVVGQPDCKLGTVTTTYQERTRSYVLDTKTSRWVPGAWSAWQTTSVSTRKATAKECKPVSPPVTPKPPHTTPVTHTEVTTVNQPECKAGKMKTVTTTITSVRKNGKWVAISTKVSTQVRNLTKAEKAKYNCAAPIEHSTGPGPKAGHSGDNPTDPTNAITGGLVAAVVLGLLTLAEMRRRRSA